MEFLQENQKTSHIPVLLDEAIEYLDIVLPGVYIDCTLGAGGYSNEIWNKILKLEGNSVLISFDLDKDAIAKFKANFSLEFESFNEIISYSHIGNKYLFLINENFSKIEEIYTKLEASFKINNKEVRGIVADLGLNSEQLDNKSGFSFQNDNQELDMRLDPNSNVKAIDLLVVGNADQLAKLIEKYGDINGAWKLARTIKERLKKISPDNFKVKDLKLCIDEALGAHIARKFELHAKVFQALRIAVNNEFENLEALLNASEKLMAINARGVIVSFHSGEDRIVKHFIKDSLVLKEVNKQIVSATYDEILNNKRAKSGKLRAFRKL